MSPLLKGRAKIAVATQEIVRAQAEALELRRRLQRAVDGEAYEEAARLRDLLRKKEATDESG